ncbi:MAG: hypothetical protein INR65_04435 [Gluconacetobacter diazotrophicus]|nr:hypothetical protein [Gluconacetobacter diazotrophicus]
MDLTLPKAWLPKLPQPRTIPVSPGRAFPSREEQRIALAAAGQTRTDTYDLLNQLGAAIAAVLYNLYGYPLQTAVYAAQAYGDYVKGAEAQGADLSRKRNPLFAAHRLAPEASSPVTAQYLTSRRWKKIGGSAVQAVGNLMSLNPANLHQNVAGAVYHGQATALTAAHVVAIESLAARHHLDQELQDWVAVVRVAKLTKLAVRGGQLAGAVIPLASMPASVVAAAAKAGVKMTYAGACFAAAAKLHFAAHLERHPVAVGVALTAEQATPAPGRAVRAAAAPGPATNFSRPFPRAGATNFSRPFGSVGPADPAAAPAPAPYLPARTSGADAIVREIFTKRGATRLFGAYDVDALIDEPAGWLALADKLMLI